MAKFGIKSLSIVSLGLSIALAPLTAFATPVNSPTGPQLIAQKSGSADKFYQQARRELPGDVYLLYRIVERLARANGLDSSPWRIVVVQDYDINAFAANANLIAVFNGLLDQMDGDTDAIACVIGHEMGHHVKRHIALGQAEKAKIHQQLKAEAEQEVKAEIQDAQRSANASAAGGTAARAVGGILGGLVGGIVGGVGGSALDTARQDRIARAEQRVQQIYETKVKEIERRWKELEHKQEFEADEQGYLFVARAGFDPKGCMRSMEVIGKVVEMESDSHPATSDRVSGLKKMAAQNPAADLVAEGKAKLAARNKPLTYALSRDGHSLRVNSYRGTVDVDRQLPR